MASHEFLNKFCTTRLLTKSFLKAQNSWLQTNYKRLNFFFPSPFPNLLLTYQTVVEEKLWGFNQELFTGVPEIWPQKTTLGFVLTFFCLFITFYIPTRFRHSDFFPLIMVRNRPLKKTEESQVKGGEMDDRTIMSATPHFLLFLHENMVFWLLLLSSLLIHLWTYLKAKEQSRPSFSRSCLRASLGIGEERNALLE